MVNMCNRRSKMADAWRHKEHYQLRTWAADFDGTVENPADGSLTTFSSTDDAVSKIGFHSVYDGYSVQKSYALADSDQTLVVTYEFGSKNDQEAFTSAIGTQWDSGAPFGAATGYSAGGKEVRHTKSEYLDRDGSVVTTITHDSR